MPDELFTKEWDKNRGLHWVDAVLKTKRHFKVSYQAVLYQLIDLGKAEHPTVYKQFHADYKDRYSKELNWKEEPLPLNRVDLIGNRFATLVRDALNKELITTSRTAEILDVRIEKIRERMKSWEVVK